jgi:hypothetical protein
MKVRVNINQQGVEINEVFTGNTSEAIVSAMKARVARELNFALRLVINGMSDLSFAQEVVRRYNENTRKNVPIPTSCDQFLQSAQTEGFAWIEP